MDIQARLHGEKEYFRQNFNRRFVETGDGVRLSCHVADRGEKCTLVLVPGTFSPYIKWTETIKGLKSGVNIAVIDWPGICGSVPVMSKSSIEELTGHLLRACAVIAPGGFIFGGHSLGGMAAVEALRQAGEGMKAVISCEGWTDCSVSSDIFGHLPPEVNSLCHPCSEISNAYREYAQEGWTPEQKRDFATLWRRWNGYSALEKTVLPVLEIWGDRSMPIRPTHAQMQIPHRENIRLSWISGACHGYLISHPARVSELIDAFTVYVLAARG